MSEFINLTRIRLFNIIFKSETGFVGLLLSIALTAIGISFIFGYNSDYRIHYDQLAFRLVDPVVDGLILGGLSLFVGCSILFRLLATDEVPRFVLYSLIFVSSVICLIKLSEIYSFGWTTGSSFYFVFLLQSYWFSWRLF